MITDFTLFNISIINPSTKERIDQGEMRYRTAKEFLDKMDKQGIPVIVEAIDDSDVADFILSNN
jgi:endonuclease IV